jgi:rhodanese-related sulfurtransferase
MNKVLLLILLLFSFEHALAYDKNKLTKKWQHTPFDLYLGAQEAYDMKQADPDKVLLIDVRNQAEIHYTGIADIVDANIPYRFDSTEWKMKKDSAYGTFKKPKNPNFATAVENLLKDKGLDKDTPLIIMCSAGTRAPFAAKVLHKAGFSRVYTQVEGFEGPRAKEGEYKGKRVVSGWKLIGLPWSYDLVPEKMYFNFDPLLRNSSSDNRPTEDDQSGEK